MLISRLVLKDFRCFNHLDLSFDNASLVLLQGANGSGKTSILEALYYTCYLRSFRTYGPQDLVHFGKDIFFMQVMLQQASSINQEISIGFTKKKRSVKIDERAVSSYKELISHFRVISLCEDDISIIRGSPEQRRAFIDQVILLHDPEYAPILRAYRQTLLHKNALLGKKNTSGELYTVWTDQLLTQSHKIKQQRISYLEQLQYTVNDLIKEFINKAMYLVISYQVKHTIDLLSTSDIHQKIPFLYQQELLFGRSLYGAHLDDISCTFADKSARSFASRGQQKIIVLLLKIAQLMLLKKERGPAIMLLDDFMTDFDLQIAQKLITLLCSLGIQLVFTSPVTEGPIEVFLRQHGAKVIKISK